MDVVALSLALADELKKSPHSKSGEVVLDISENNQTGHINIKTEEQAVSSSISLVDMW